MDQDLISVLELIEADIKLKVAPIKKFSPASSKHFCKLFFFEPELSGSRIKCFTCIECGHHKYTRDQPPTVKTEWKPEMDLLVDYFPKLEAELAGLKRSVANKITHKHEPRYKTRCNVCCFLANPKLLVLE